MDKNLFKAFKHYHKHRKGYQEKLDVFTKYLDGIEYEQGIEAEKTQHRESKEEKQMAQQAEKTLGNIRKLLRSMDEKT